MKTKLLVLIFLIAASLHSVAQSCSFHPANSWPLNSQSNEQYMTGDLYPNGDKVIVSLTFNSGTSDSIRVARFDQSGTPIWIQPLHPVDPTIRLFPSHSAVTPLGHAVICGTYTHVGGSLYGGFALELDGNGNFVWAKTYDRGYLKIFPLSTGGYLLSGALAGTQMAWLNASGEPTNTASLAYGTNGTAVGLGNGEVSASGDFFFPYQASSSRSGLIRMDEAGIIDPSLAPLISEISVYTAIELSSGDILLGGQNGSAPGLQKISSTGATIWSYRYPSAWSQIVELAELSSGTIIGDIKGTDYSTSDDYYAPATFDATGNFIEYWNGSPGFDMDFWGELNNILGVSGNTVYYAGDGDLGGYVPIIVESNTVVPDFSCSHNAGTANMTTLPVALGSNSIPVLDSLNWIADSTSCTPLLLQGLQNGPPGVDIHTILISGFARPGFTLPYYGFISNFGADISGDVDAYIILDSSLTIQTATPTPSLISGDTLFWNNLGALNYGDNASFHVDCLVPPDTTLLGTTLNSSIHAFQDSVEFTLTNNVDLHGVVVTGSYDPNDKLVQPEYAFEPQSDSLLHYTIRFQNTGTDTAFNILIVDTLPAELDVNSITSSVSSHPNAMQLETGGVLKFMFNNILLPDSNVNEAGSHGLVSFWIRPLEQTPIGTLISNEADIYFDFNPPIRTPPALVFYGLTTGVSTLVTSNELSVYPVPVDDFLTLSVSVDFEATELFIHSIDGRLVRLSRTAAIQGSHVLPTGDLHAGQYVLTLVNAQGERLTARFVKE